MSNGITANLIGPLLAAVVLIVMAVSMIGFAGGLQAWIVKYQLKWVRPKWARSFIQSGSYLWNLRLVGFICVLMAAVLLYMTYHQLRFG